MLVLTRFTAVDSPRRDSMDLDDATITRPDGRPAERVDHIHIRGRLVRYVQIPPEIDIVTAINERVRGSLCCSN